MQVNNIKPTGYHVRDRILSFFIALIMLISSVSVPEIFSFAADADNTGGFELSMSWNSDDTNDNKDNPSTAYLYDSGKDETRIVTLKVKYQNKEVSRYDYEAGSIIITVPGLWGAVRSEKSYIPVGVAADKMSDTNKTHDWSYSYTETTDTFTFVNNNKIDAKSTFEGSFEIMWKIPSRKTIDDCSLELIGKLNAVVTHGEDVENYAAESNTVTYEQKRKRDVYTIEEKAEWLYKDEPIEEDYDNCTWVKYTISGTDTYYARDVEGSERFDCYFLEVAEVQGAGLQKIEGKIRNDLGDGKIYQCWSVEKDIKSGDSIFLEGIFVKYPQKYMNAEVYNYVELYGTYYDEKEETRLASTNEPDDLSKYHYQDIPGDIYDVDKYSHGVRNSYINKHCDDLCKIYGAINAAHLSGNREEYKSSFDLKLNFKDKEKTIDEDGNVTEIPLDLDYYDLEFVDDIMDIYQKDGNSFQQLEDDEYHFTRIIIPSNEKIRNKNGLPIKADTYDVEIYFRHANGEFPYKLLTDEIMEGDDKPEPYYTTKITSSEQEIEITDTDVVGVKIVVRGVKESFYTDDIYCCYQFDISDDKLSKIDTNNSQLINNMYFNLYKKASVSGKYEWYNNKFSAAEYSDEREYYRDMALYGNPLDREKAALHILEIPSEFKIQGVRLEETQTTQYMAAYNGSITSEFTLGEGADYSRFSMYTILPEDMLLFDNCNTPETLKDVLIFSGEDGLSSAYISEHTTIEIIPDYKGTGRQYLAFHYNFDRPTTSKMITVSSIPIYINKDNIKEQSKAYTMYAGMLIDQNGNWYSTSKDEYSIDDGIWKDMDHDNNTEEPASFGNTHIEVMNPKSDNVELVKFVKTSKTVGYVNPGENEYVPMTYAGGTYSYRLRACVGADNSVKNFIFFDAIETHDGTVWQGEFDHIDYSYAKEVFGGVEPTIYYSTEVETFESDTNDGSYIITPDALKGENWTTEKPNEVRSVAVYFGDAVAESKSVIYIDIIMKAPEDKELYGKITVNDCAVGYDKVTGGNVEHENLPSNAVRVKFVPYMGKITLTKKDADNGQTITAEAKFELYRKGDTPDKDEKIGEYTTQNGKIVVRDLLYGTYYFKEIEAPKGYECSEEIKEVTLYGEEPDASVACDFTNERKKGEVTFKKVSDRDETRGLQGAKFNVYDANNKDIKSVTTDEDGYLVVDNLDWGSYYLKETKAPAGYMLSEEITEFVINAENDAGRDLKFVIKNEQKPAYATLIKKESIVNGGDGKKLLPGAVYELHKADDTLLGTYMTDKDGKIYAEDLTFGKYYFKETIAPKGYELAERNIEFEVTAEHTSKALEVPVVDDRKLGRVSLLKLDDEKQPVKDAVYGLFNAETHEQIDVTGKPSTETFKTTAEGYIELNNLWWGAYYLKELKAPTGYQLNAEEIKFTVDENNVSKRILLYTKDPRLKGEVKLVKYDANETTTLQNAVYTLYRNDGSIFKDNLTTDADGIISVSDLPWGSYYFLEKTPPNGYGLSSEKIRFSVNYLTAGKPQELTATDPQINYKLTVVKKIKISDIVFSHGNPTFTFKVVGNKGNTYHQAVTFSEEYLKEYQNKNPNAEYIEASVIFAELGMDTYTVTEIETNRYETGDVEAENGTVNEDKTAAEFKIDDNNKDYKAVFTNKKTTQGGLSHTSQISNILKRSRKYTALVAVWKGSETITENTLNRDSLEVWAVYDDGTQVKLDNEKYTLDPESFDSSMNGDYTVKVSYADGGITRSDSFVVKIDVSDPFTWKITEGGFDEGETHYDGTAIINGYLGTAKVLNIPKSVTGWVELTDSNGAYSEHTDYAGKKYKVVGVEGKNIYSAMYGIDKCDMLKLPEGLETIANNTFKDCTNLKDDLEIPDSVTSIGDYAFESCGFTGSLKLGNGVKSIASKAFYRVKFSGDLEIPDSVTSIGDYAFYSCGFTGSLKLGNSVKTIGDYAFCECGFKGTLMLGNSVETIGEHAFQLVKFSGELEIPDSVTSIGNAAFYLGGFTGNLTFGQNSQLKTIGNFAFAQCGFTGALAIPSTVQTIGNKAFFKCSGFNGTLTFGENSNLKTIGDYAFTGRSNTTDTNVRYDIHFTGLLKIPGSVESIGECAFRCDTGFTGLELQEGIKEIGSYAFDGCTGFTGSLAIPNSVTSIGDGAFKSCSGFTGNLVIPSSLTSIKKETFRFCSGLNGNLTIPNSVTEIGNYAFGSCKNLSGDLIIPGSVTEIGQGAFIECQSFNPELTLNDGLEKIKNQAFSTCYFTKITIPRTIEEIGLEQTFAFFSRERTIFVPNSKKEQYPEDSSAFKVGWTGYKYTITYYD